MIDLTPLEVRKKKGDFRRTVRGYDPQLVDDFLDMVADRLEELVRENIAFNERCGRLEERVGDYREREKALTEALVSAQEFRQERLSEASREADLRLREADAEARRIRDEALRDKEREEDGVRRVRARRSQMVESFRAFLERELQQLNVESAALELSEAAVEAAARVWELGANGAGAGEVEDAAPPAKAAPPPAPAKAPPARAAVRTAPPAAPVAAPAPAPAAPARAGRLEPSVEPPFRLDPEPLPGEEPIDDGPPITGDEEWLPLLEDEK